MSEQSLPSKRRPDELQEIVRALQADEIDAVVVLEKDGERLARLHRDEPLYRDIVDHLPQSVATVLPDGVIVYLNNALAKLLGRNAAEMLGANVAGAVAECDRHKFVAMLQRAVTSPQEESFTFSWSGGGAPALVSASRLPMSGAAAIALVITDIREQVARQAAEEAIRAKDEILASVSHELRVPLAAMAGWLYLLQMDLPPDSPFYAPLQEMKNAVNAQTRIVEDLLNLARSERGTLPVELQDIDVCDPLRIALSFVRAEAERKSLQLRHALPSDPVVVRGDRIKLQQVFVNVLSNAVKFTSDGEVSVRLAREQRQVVVEVSDTGDGIDGEFLPHVFEPFRRESRAAGRPGIGIGLAIARRIIEAHGGTIDAASDGLDHGSTFTIKLPLAE